MLLPNNHWIVSTSFSQHERALHCLREIYLSVCQYILMADSEEMWCLVCCQNVSSEYQFLGFNTLILDWVFLKRFKHYYACVKASNWLDWRQVQWRRWRHQQAETFKQPNGLWTVLFDEVLHDSSSNDSGQLSSSLSHIYNMMKSGEMKKRMVRQIDAIYTNTQYIHSVASLLLGTRS